MTTRRLILPSKLPEFGINLTDRQLRRLEASGKFPKRVHISARAFAYDEAELSAFIEAKLNERDGGRAA